MSTTQPAPSRSRKPLSRDRILEAAVAVADVEGVAELTMRRLGSELGVEAMSLYKHVTGKDEIIDGIIDLVVAEIAVPAPETPWRTAMRERAISARDVLSRHPWAVGLLEARSAPGPAAMRYLEGIVANLRQAGFSITDAAHAFWLLDSYIYGHVIQEASIPFDSAEQAAASAGEILDALSDDHPHLAEMARHAASGGFDYHREFAYGLDLILDGLARRRPGPEAGEAGRQAQVKR